MVGQEMPGGLFVAEVGCPRGSRGVVGGVGSGGADDRGPVRNGTRRCHWPGAQEAWEGRDRTESWIQGATAWRGSGSRVGWPDVRGLGGVEAWC